MKTIIRSQLRRIVAVIILIIAFYIAQLPRISDAEREQLAGQFAFTEIPMPVVTPSNRTIRVVHQDLENIAGWISSVGAAVALNDLDNDGLANDSCYVDTRSDDVVIAAVPGIGERYQPFALHHPSQYDATMAPMGCVPGDVNEDGAVDLLVYYWGRPPVIYLRDTSIRILSADAYRPQEVVDHIERWFTNAAGLADVDGDTHPDIIIGNYFRDGATILDPTNTEPQSMQHSMSRAFNAGVNRILLWQNATPTSVDYIVADTGLDENVLHGWTLALATADLDGDLLPEIYFANDFGPDRLLYNRSQPGKLEFTLVEQGESLTLPSSRILGHDSFKGMGADFVDFNRDGVFDIYVSNIADDFALEESHFLYVSTGDVSLIRQGIAPYTDQGEQLGLSRSNWGWDSRLADMNNDGVVEALQVTGFLKGEVNRWPQLHELALGNDELLAYPRLWPRFAAGDDLSGDGHLFFFVRSQSGRYYDVSQNIGVGRDAIGRGIALADVDGDGDLDFITANQWDNAYYYENNSAATGTALTLQLVYPVGDTPAEFAVLPANAVVGLTTRAAIGATARLLRSDGVQISAQVDGGSGHSGKRSHEIHFGLGDVSQDEMLSVVLQWRGLDGTPQERTISIQPGRYTVVLN